MFLLSNCIKMFTCLLVLSCYTPGILFSVAAAIVLSHDCACASFNCVGIWSQPCVMYPEQDAFSSFSWALHQPFHSSFCASIKTYPSVLYRMTANVILRIITHLLQLIYHSHTTLLSH